MTLKPNSKPPYPVLAELTDDYQQDSTYQAEFLVRRQVGDAIVIAARHQLASPGIEFLLKAGKAQYGVRAFCAATRQRDLLLSSEPHQTLSLPDEEYTGTTRLIPVILTTEAIPDYQAADWSEKTKILLMGPIALPPATLLAQGRTLRFKTGDLNSGDSIVQLIPADRVDQGKIEIDLESEKIKILVDPETFKQIRDMQANEDISGALWPSLYQQAIQRGLRFHRDENYQGKRWAINLARRLAAATDGDLPDDETLIHKDYAYAQLIMDNPLSKMLEIRALPEEN